jgi:DNA-binding transcriptional MerR regulator
MSVSNHTQRASGLGQFRLAYTRTEAAKLLGINPITLDRLTKRGLIRPSRAIRRPLYPHTELVRFLEDTKLLEL